MTKHKVADETDLAADGDRIISDVDGLEVAVFRTDGEYHAVVNFCPHQGGPLCEGPRTGELRGSVDGWQFEYDDDPDVIVCPWHGWRFSVETGESIDTERYRVPTYEVVVEDGEIFVLR